jgi:hypothetical protein
MNQNALIREVQEQRSKLLNVLGAVQCMQIAVRHEPPPEIEGAVELLEEEIQRICDGLDYLVLERKLSENVGADSPEAEEQS